MPMRPRAGEPVPWDEVIEGLVEPVAASRLSRGPARHAVYAN